MTLILEELEMTLVGRVYTDAVKTSAYIVPTSENRHLFTKDQLLLIDNQTF